MEFTKVATIDENEFGYFEVVSAYHTIYKCMVFNNEKKKQQVLCIEDSPGEATEAIIEQFIKKGFNLNGWEFEGKPDFVYPQ